ncbi:metal ABC transporter ATP-binding protein [Halopenitus sp. H-Gu1]|uniref:metal ABC transporter ATP-binding protein n=1 Tax=Halopenitus sp. H-Gu1 TaxID=3242697 RepID=UPI00359ECC99
MNTVVSVRDVTYTYGDTVAIDDVSLDVADGEFLGLIGPNGSGKTTLLHLMLGLLDPDSGEIRLFGEPVSSFEDGHRIGYVAQQATQKGSTMPVTVEEVVEMGRYPLRGSERFRSEDHRIVEDAMERVDVIDLRHRRINALSGGQRQRAYIARALASEADLLALDEPTVGVDAESRDRFYGLLDELNDDGITIVLIEHDIGVVTDRAERIACLNRELYHHGDTESFVESDALERAYGTTGTVVHHHH